MTMNTTPLRVVRKTVIKKSSVASEYNECIFLVQYLDLLKRKGLIRQYTHIPNETFTTSWNAKRKNKAMGVQSGFPDYVVITNKEVLFIEMKKAKGGVTSDSQKEWLASLQSVGQGASVCNGFEAAKIFVDGYLGL